MIIISKIIVHTMDPTSNILVCSDLCMDVDEVCINVLENKITKAFTSEKRKSGIFKKESPIKHMVEDYQAGLSDFETMSQNITKYIFELKCKCGLFDPSSFILAEILYENHKYLVGLDNVYLDGLSYMTKQVGDQRKNEIMIQSTLISSTLIKRDSAFMIEYDDMLVSSVETETEIDTEKQYFYGDVVLVCISSPSYNEAVKTIAKACEETVFEFSLDPIETMHKMKQIIKGKVEAQEDIHIEDVAQAMFGNHPLARKQFEQQVKEQGVFRPITVEHMKTRKSERLQKLRTDKKIEIIIPANYIKFKCFL